MRQKFMVDNLRCTLCEKTSDIEVLHSELRYEYPAKIYTCKDCSFVFLHPQLNQEELNKYYKEEYRSNYEDEPVKNRFSKDLLEADVRLKRIEKKFLNVNKLLEIGSGSGAFLSLAHEKIEYAAGIELDKNACDFMKQKGLNVFSDLKGLHAHKFDLIVLFHVLEHLENPVFFLKELKNHLAEGGKIIVEVPNVDDALVSFYDIDEFKNFYFCSAHVSYFSEKTLLDCLQLADFFGVIEQIQRYDLNNHIHWLKFKKPEVLLDKEKIFSESTLRSYERDLTSKKMGDTLWGVFHSIK